MNAVGTVRGARGDLVQKDNIAVPFFDPHGVRCQVIEPRVESSQFVIVGCEQGATFIDVMQMLDRGPGD